MWTIWSRMKSKFPFLRLPVLFFSMTVGLALLSWIGSIYGWQSVQSLLGADGVRWVLRHVLADYVQTPALGIVLVTLMGLGIGVRAGLYHALRRMLQRGKQLSGKERRAFRLSLACLVVYLTVVTFSTPYLKSVTGSLLHSPFEAGFFYILSFGLGLSGIVYGYASNTCRTSADIIEGMSCLIARRATYFVTLFMVVQFFSVLRYTGLADGTPFDGTVQDVAFQLCCYLPLLGRG